MARSSSLRILPKIARAFLINDFLLLEERAAGSGARELRKTISEPVRQKYERWLDRAVVRALFARIPLLVEGPSDRAVVEVFWRALSQAPGENGGAETVRSAEQLGLDVVSCEGAGDMPMMARLLKEAGKPVAVWAERDREEVREILERLRTEGNCAAIVLHDEQPGKQSLEEALAQAASVGALVKALEVLATTRGYSLEEQKRALVSASESIAEERRQRMKVATSLLEIFEPLAEAEKRSLVSRALSAKSVTPFEMKGSRQGRIVAETILEVDRRVPSPFQRAIRGVNRWIAEGCRTGTEVAMAE